MPVTRSLLLWLLLTVPVLAGTSQPLPTVRWADGAAGCALRRGDDGRTYYSLATRDLEVTLAVDNLELEKVRRRTIPMIGVLVSVNYRGTEPVGLAPSPSTLEFTKHFQIVQHALDPDTMLQQLQQAMDNLTDEVTRHQIKKHPEKKEGMESELQQRLKDYTEMMDFISTKALRGVVLDPSSPSASGWIFFSTKNRWIGPWRKPEQLVFRIPITNAIVEFPFQLPPRGGKVELRQRPAE